MNAFRSSRSASRFAMAMVVTIAAACLSITGAIGADGGDPVQQTKASSEQIEKLIGTLRDSGAMSGTDLLQRRSGFEKLMGSTPGPARVQIRHVDAMAWIAI